MEMKGRGPHFLEESLITGLNHSSCMQASHRWADIINFKCISEHAPAQGQGSLVGCCLWGRTESDTTEVT